MAKESKGIIIGTERAYRSSRLSFSVLSVPSAVGAQATQAAERESSCVAKGSTLNRYVPLFSSCGSALFRRISFFSSFN